MKRKPKDFESPIGKWFPFRTLFAWKECDICGMEFKREKGFVGTRFCSPQFMSSAIYESVYHCEQCHITRRKG
jgi:hypothetical protein